MTGGVKAVVKTNNVKGSICKIGIEPVKFSALWKAYPDGMPSQAKDADGNLLYPNQCAIKVSVALHLVGVEMKSFKGATTPVNGKQAAIRAEELATWLSKMPFCGLPQRPDDVTGEDWALKVKSRSGIIFFADYWTRPGESAQNASGDHIDLWNGEKMTGLGSGLRARFGIVIPNIWSDLRKSRRIMFFPMA